MLKYILYFLCLFSFFYSSAQTAIDGSFGTNGYVENMRLNGKDGKRMIPLQDGKFLLIGSTVSYTPQIMISKFHEDGLPDTEFGVLGMRGILLDERYEYNLLSAILCDDSMLMIGLSCYYSSGGGMSCFVLLKTDLNGILDNTFGINGIMTTAPVYNRGVIDALDGLAIDRNKNILLAFSRQYISELKRYKPNGELDTLFQQKGELKMSDTKQVWIQHLAVTKDNRYLISYTFTGSWRTIFVEPRDSNGNAITNDSLNNKMRIDFDPFIARYSFGLHMDKYDNIFTYFCYGDILNQPPYDVVNTNIWIYKYDKWGNPIKLFGNNGMASHKLAKKISWDGIEKLSFDSKDRIVFGFAYIDTLITRSNNSIYMKNISMVCRLTPKGFLDSAFNNKGLFETFKDSALNIRLKDVVLKADNKIVVSGLISHISGSCRPLICRFNELSPNTSVVKLSDDNTRTYTTYPSPFNNSLTVAGISQPFNYTIHNTLGQLAFSGYSDNATIDNLGFLLQGLYTLTVNDGEKIFVIKIVKG
ncbi:MAG: T9SS type A sorting domain-containing protein [Bacteroidota bacterium]